jgi:hypothetical protein
MDMNFQNHIATKTNDELISIFLNAEQYQPEFVDLAIEELNKRNVDISSCKIAKEANEITTLEKIANGKQGSAVYISLGFISALLGGILGIFIGYTYAQSRNKEIGDGSIYIYNQNTRNLGTGMMLLGIADFFILIVLKFSD